MLKIKKMIPLKENISFNIHDVNTWKEYFSKKKEGKAETVQESCVAKTKKNDSLVRYLWLYQQVES